MVIWFIGLSASGKTTIAQKLYEKLQNISDEKWLFVDGDMFRYILGEDLRHSIKDREKNGERISKFCEFLDSQNVNVIACVLSIFHHHQKYNRENFSNYKEVYIKVDFDKLLQRDNKNLYQKALNKETNNVVGVDIEFVPPYNPDLVIDNNTDNPDYDKIVNKIIDSFDIPVNKQYIYTKNNLLTYPHKYQYSKFEGEEFFDKFFADRDKSIKFLEKRLKRLPKKELKESVYKDNETLFLKPFLTYLYLNDEKNGIIDILLKRFEISKKLYLSYDLKNIKKSSTQYDEMLNYPLFSLVLQKYYTQSDKYQKFIYLNTILKVNDLISSVKEEFILYEEVFYALKALKGEVEITKGML